MRNIYPFGKAPFVILIIAIVSGIVFLWMRLGEKKDRPDLILAIQSAGVERGRNGFHKNKSMEKQPESEEDLLEHRTDGTDAFDTLYIGCEKFPQHEVYPVALGGVL